MRGLRMRTSQLPRKLSLVRNSREYWVCVCCGKPKRARIYVGKACKYCGTRAPWGLVIEARPGPNSAVRRGKHATTMVSVTRATRKTIGLYRKGEQASGEFSEFLSQVGITRSGDTPECGGWYTQIFTFRGRFTGVLDYDVCFFSPPSEVIAAMTKTKMMQIRIPEDLHKWFKRHTQQNETSMTKVLVTYIERLRVRNSKVEVDQI